MPKRPHAPHPLDESELQYHVELWSPDGNRFERCVAASSRVGMASALVPVAAQEFPDNRIIVRQGGRVIADSASLKVTRGHNGPP